MQDAVFAADKEVSTNIHRLGRGASSGTYRRLRISAFLAGSLLSEVDK